MGNFACVVVAGLVAMGAQGAMFAMDPVPGATLLLPYFEVDLEPQGNMNTTFIVRNSMPDETVAHVVLHTDYAVSTLCFDVHLTGYDMESFDLREVFLGNVVHLAQDTPVDDPLPPGTDHALFQSGFETGTLVEWDANVSRATAQGLQAHHRGKMDLRNLDFAGRDHGDDRIRGFVTIDVANDFGAGFPHEEGYFGQGGTGRVDNSNRLWGEFELVSDANNFSMANTLISVEADEAAFVNGDYSFYGRYVEGTAVDNREPLGETWATRFIDGGLSGNSDILYWRDPKAVQLSLAGEQTPPWHPLPQAQLVVFDEEENPEEVAGIQSFPLACGRVAVGTEALPSSFMFGWLYINFAFTNAQTNLFGSAAQGVVLLNVQSTGRFEAGMMGVPLGIAGAVN